MHYSACKKVMFVALILVIHCSELSASEIPVYGPNKTLLDDVKQSESAKLLKRSHASLTSGLSEKELLDFYINNLKLHDPALCNELAQGIRLNKSQCSAFGHCYCAGDIYPFAREKIHEIGKGAFPLDRIMSQDVNCFLCMLGKRVAAQEEWSV